MFSLIMVPTNSNTNIVLLFKTEDNAKATREKIHEFRKKWFASQEDTLITAKDDYGHTVDISASYIGIMLLADAALEILAGQDKDIASKRGNKAFGERIHSDPELQVMYSRPQIINPAMPGGMQ